MGSKGTVIGSLLCALALAGCATTEKAVSYAPGAIQSEAVVTEEQRRPCEGPEITAGADKVVLIGQQSIALKECERKRKALVGQIDDKNQQIKQANDKINRQAQGKK